jgi:hypothetical protein
MGLASVAEAVWEVLMEWEVRTRWLSSWLASDGPRGRRVRVGGGSKLEVGMLVVERNFAEFLLTVYFGTPSMFITLWFGFDYGTNQPLGTLII